MYMHSCLCTQVYSCIYARDTSIHAWVHIHTCIHACVHECAGADLRHTPLSPSTLFFETGYLTEPRVHQLSQTGWQVGTRDPFVCSASLVLGACPSIQLLYGCWRSKHRCSSLCSEHFTSTAGHLPTLDSGYAALKQHLNPLSPAFTARC